MLNDKREVRRRSSGWFSHPISVHCKALPHTATRGARCNNHQTNAPEQRPAPPWFPAAPRTRTPFVTFHCPMPDRSLPHWPQRLRASSSAALAFSMPPAPWRSVRRCERASRLAARCLPFPGQPALADPSSYPFWPISITAYVATVRHVRTNSYAQATVCTFSNLFSI
jgi:hypothetical protein